MTTLKSLMLNLFTLILFISPTVVLADFKSDIIASCTDYQQGKDKSTINACKLYIDGFFDSSLLTNNGVIKPQAMIDQKQKQQSEYNRKETASQLAKSIDTHLLNNKQLKEVFFDTLIKD